MIRGSYCLFPVVGVGILQCLLNFSYHVIWRLHPFATPTNYLYFCTGFVLIKNRTFLNESFRKIKDKLLLLAYKTRDKLQFRSFHRFRFLVTL